MRGMLQSYHEHGISTPECLLIEVNRTCCCTAVNSGFALSVTDGTHTANIGLLGLRRMRVSARTAAVTLSSTAYGTFNLARLARFAACPSVIPPLPATLSDRLSRCCSQGSQSERQNGQAPCRQDGRNEI